MTPDDYLRVELCGGRAQAVFTSRRGGCSSGPYESLNLGRLTADDPAAVEQNRAVVERALGIRLTPMRQVHGARVLALDGVAGVEEADGQATATPGVAASVLTADCLPVAVAGPGAVAMLHAGWRGLAGGVLQRGIEKLRELRERGSLEAVIGPGAGPCCYEVGDEVRAAFGGRFARGRMLALKAAARAALQEAGVTVIHDVRRCTICDPLYFSHRRDGGVTGRQAGIAWLS
jgi:YfiH family protein